ncbi:RNA pseudouridylate synthase domain-containing protein 4 [Toxocara canis]|uniref:Pseudouridylate synthase RPUSD4, mitochondrial n=1 Tax=Toxocara canis TaxID=6265 RepID=A0A0B2VDR5_TOXCA|nr:RNA pseudouridylate synthase domain-containing protein 4 [Toxocara canis]
MAEMKADKDEDDFFGIEYATSSPIPQHMLNKSTDKKKKRSGTDFIDAQYFGKLNGYVEEENQMETVDGATFIEEQYFAYTPSASPTDKAQSSSGCEEVSKSTATIIDKKRDMERMREMKPDEETTDEIAYFSQQLLSHNPNHQSMLGVSNVDNLSIISQQHLQRPGQERAEKEKLEVANKSSRVVISKPKIVLEDEVNGLDKIRNLIEPVWKMNDKELVEMMCKRVIYEDDDLLAFDKPYQMAYSGAKRGQAQMDRILQDIKACIAPDVPRLCLVKSLDKSITGVILLAKNSSVQKTIVEKYREGAVEQRYRTIVRGVPEESEAIINIPLVKKSYKQNFIMRPLLPGSKIRPFCTTTEYRVISDNGECSSLRCIVTNDVAHQIRSHLGLGLSCPIIGDAKYSGKNEFQPTKLPADTMRRLQLTGNQYRRLPMYLHLSEVSIPVASPGSRTINIRAPLPAFFVHTLKKLRLMKI